MVKNTNLWHTIVIKYTIVTMEVEISYVLITLSRIADVMHSITRKHFVHAKSFALQHSLC